MFNALLESATRLLPLLVTMAVVFATLTLANHYLRRRWAGQPTEQFRFQLIMLALTLAGLVAVLVVLPVSETLRGQLLSLLGILLSAAIALSSTTFIGNIMAGLMLRLLRNARPGDFITVADLTGRITEMDLLHTEIQTEQRDLVTVPNLYMVTHPTKVVRASGTIIAADVSLGYDVSHDTVRGLLIEATERAGLGEGFVQVRDLGDFSVSYRASGLLEDVKSLLTARSALRAAMLDVLHEAGVEIVSPNFMNTRSRDADQPIIPAPAAAVPETPSAQLAEDVMFDKAESAASVEELRKTIESLQSELSQLDDSLVNGNTSDRQRRERRLAMLTQRLAVAEEALKKDGAEKS